MIVTPEGQCSLSDCREPAAFRLIARSASERTWATEKCEKHREIGEDAITALGLTLVAVVTLAKEPKP